MNNHFRRLSAISLIAVMTALHPTASVAAKAHKASSPHRATAAPPAPSGAVTSQPFTWNRSYHVGSTYDYYLSQFAVGKTFGGKPINKGHTDHLRFKFNAIRSGDSNHSDQVQLFFWVERLGGFNGEPEANWARTEWKGTEAFGSNSPMLYKLFPYLQIYKAGTYQPGSSFTLSEPEGFTQTRNTTVTYRGMQMVGKVNCGYFEYSDRVTDAGGQGGDDDTKKEIWIDPRDGVYRYECERRTYEFNLGNSRGTATDTKILARL